MQWISRSSTARSFERKWSPKIRPPYKHLEDLEDDVTLVFRKPSWQLRASLASVLITPVLYQLYLIMVTIRYILFLQTFSSPPRPACPVVDLSWTGVFPCELGWRGSALAVLILSAVLITCYSLIIACLVRWNPRNIQYCTTVFGTQEKPTKFQVRVQSTNRLMLPPTLSLCILLLIFRLLLQSGDVEANPGPTFCSILTIDDLNSVYEKLIEAAENWLDLGLALGLGHSTLSNIKGEHRDKNQTCLREMLAVRLKTGPPLTYSDICRSLRARTVKRNDVAVTIEMECTDDDTSPGPSKRQKLSTMTPGPTKPKSDNRLEKKEGEHSENQHLTVDIIVREVGIRKEVLDQRCLSEVLEEIGRVLPNWLKYAKVLLSKAQIQGIKTDTNLDYEMRGQKVLEIWLNEYNTSYRMLVDICLKLKDGETARRICEIVKESNPLKRKRKREDTKDDENGGM
ncbi:uncharacterized protein LOC135347321 [Halichondria panicea]|uniref:uncharacterized protein LOC135347321 n=1 Tax=Halichondria panicea TaxID=6063 RepID=UPI00312B5A96